MKVEIRSTEVEEIDYFDVLRRSPVKDVKGAAKTLRECLNLSANVWVGLVDDNIACIWGLVPPSLLSNQAYLWLLHTDVVTEHQFVFIRQSQIALREMLEKYPIIVGCCIIGENKTIRWMKWLGARFGKPQGNRIPFVIEAKHG